MQRYGPRRTLSVDLRRALHLGGNPCDFQVYAAGLLSGISGGCIAGRTERFEWVRDLADGRRTDDPRGDRACIFGSQTVIVQRDSNSVAADQSSPADVRRQSLADLRSGLTQMSHSGSGEKALDPAAQAAQVPEIIVRTFSAGLTRRPRPKVPFFIRARHVTAPDLECDPSSRCSLPLSAELRLATVSAPGGMAPGKDSPLPATPRLCVR